MLLLFVSHVLLLFVLLRIVLHLVACVATCCCPFTVFVVCFFYLQIGDVRTNFSMPDVQSIPLGGGTLVQYDSNVSNQDHFNSKASHTAAS